MTYPHVLSCCFFFFKNMTTLSMLVIKLLNLIILQSPSKNPNYFSCNLIYIFHSFFKIFMVFCLPILTFQNFYFPFVFQCLLFTNFQFQVRILFLNVSFFLPFSSTIVCNFWLFFPRLLSRISHSLSFLISKKFHSYIFFPLLGILPSSTSPIFFKKVVMKMNNTKVF